MKIVCSPSNRALWRQHIKLHQANINQDGRGGGEEIYLVELISSIVNNMLHVGEDS